MTKEELNLKIIDDLENNYSIGVLETNVDEEDVNNYLTNVIEYNNRYGIKEMVKAYGVFDKYGSVDAIICDATKRYSIIMAYPLALTHNLTQTYLGFSEKTDILPLYKQENYSCLVTKICDSLQYVPNEFVYGIIEIDDEKNIVNAYYNENHYSNLDEIGRDYFYDSLITTIEGTSIAKTRFRKLKERIELYTLPYDEVYFDSMIGLDQISERHNILRVSDDVRMRNNYAEFAKNVAMQQEIVEVFNEIDDTIEEEQSAEEIDTSSDQSDSVEIEDSYIEPVELLNNEEESEILHFKDVDTSYRIIVSRQLARNIQSMQEELQFNYINEFKNIVLDNSFKDACNEVRCLLNLMDYEDKKDIPESLIKFIEHSSKGMNDVYFDPSKSLDEQSLSGKTKELLTIIYRNYYLNDEQRSRLDLALIDNESEYEEELKDKYSLLSLFKSDEVFESDEYLELMNDDSLAFFNNNFIKKTFYKIRFFLKLKNVII